MSAAEVKVSFLVDWSETTVEGELNVFWSTTTFAVDDTSHDFCDLGESVFERGLWSLSDSNVQGITMLVALYIWLGASVEF